MTQYDPLFTANIKQAADLAIARRIASAGYGDFAVAGGTIGYGVNFPEFYRRSAIGLAALWRRMDSDHERSNGESRGHR